MNKFSSPFMAKSPLNTPQPWETTIAGQVEGDDRFLDINQSPVNPDGTPRHQTSTEKDLIASQQKEDIASQQEDSKSPVKQIKLKKRGRVLHENFSLDGDMVEDNDFVDKIVNDPKGILNRPMTNREFKKGYKVKRGKDGSITLKGRRGN